MFGADDFARHEELWGYRWGGRDHVRNLRPRFKRRSWLEVRAGDEFNDPVLVQDGQPIRPNQPGHEQYQNQDARRRIAEHEGAPIQLFLGQQSKS
jgi:hypothetical protein